MPLDPTSETTPGSACQDSGCSHGCACSVGVIPAVWSLSGRCRDTSNYDVAYFRFEPEAETYQEGTVEVTGCFWDIIVEINYCATAVLIVTAS